MVVLDIMLPGMSGLDVLRDLRDAGIAVPVLMLTAKGDIVDRVFGLELGADDYVPKPFAVHELLARVRALLEACPARDPVSARDAGVGGVRFDFRGLTARGPTGDPGLTTHDVLVLKCWRAARRGRGRVSTSSRRSAGSTPRPRSGPSTTISSHCGGRSATIRSGRASCIPSAARAIA